MSDSVPATAVEGGLLRIGFLDADILTTLLPKGKLEMVHVVEASDGNETTWKSPQGSLTISRPEPEVLVFTERGHLDERFAQFIAKASNAALLSSRQLHLFVDCIDLVSYAPGIRKQPTDWLLANRDRVAVQHMLVRSPLTKMGLSVASLALGGLIKGHSSRGSFNMAFDLTLRMLRGSDRVAASVGRGAGTGPALVRNAAATRWGIFS